MTLTNLVRDWTIRSNKLERIWLLAKIEFKLRYYENRLGLFWALLKPVMDMCIYYVAFKIVLKTDVPAFASYLFIALVIWNFFLESTTGTIQLLHTKKYLYEYSNMNKMEIYISTLLANSIGFLFNLAMFFLFYNILETHGHGISFNGLWIAVLFINLFILSLGTSLILSNLYIIAKDIHQVWIIFTSFLFFLSPIFYKLSVYQKALPGFIWINPIAGIIVNARKVLMDARTPDFRMMLTDFIYGLLVLFIGLSLLDLLGAKAAEKL